MSHAAESRDACRPKPGGDRGLVRSRPYHVSTCTSGCAWSDNRCVTEPPSGTVTLLFSDIEGSTALLTRLGDAYADALDLQRRILRQAWVAHGGLELGTEGDSFFVVFSAATAGVAAAEAAQRELSTVTWPEGARVRVRMGIHTGSPTPHDDGNVGIDVHRAARVAGAAHGGQVVITEPTRALVGNRLPVGAATRDLGWHRLKDLAEPEHLFEVVPAGSTEEFPPLRSMGATSRLPAEVTPLVGRDEAMAELTALVRDANVRLITMTGPGGSGKTRLATAVAARVAGRFGNGVFFVPLSQVTDAEGMVGEVGEAIGVRSGQRELRDLIEELHPQRALLVLDNLEQLKGADSVVHELLVGAPQLVVLATARGPLHLRGEHEFPVQPLTLPTDETLSAAEASGAVQMFVRQAQMVRPNFVLDEENLGSVVTICRRLDGLPLAIELAAARMKLLSPAALVDRLETTLELGAGGRDLPERQQTLRDTIDWSYQLLGNEGCRSLRRLGVFAGGAAFDAVQAVVTDGRDPFDRIAELVDVALVAVAEDNDSALRVVLLGAVRDFAREQLADRGELADASRRHTEYFVERTEALSAQLHTRRDLSARNQIEADYDNIREGLTWSLRPGGDAPPPEDVDLGLRLVASLRELWTLPYPESNPKPWLRRAAELGEGRESRTMAAVLASLARGIDEESGRRALEMSRRLGDERGMAEALHTLEWFHQDDPETGLALLQESIGLARSSGDDKRLSWVLGRSANLEMRRGHPDKALALLGEAVDLAGRRGDERTASEARLDTTYPLIALGHVEDAFANLNENVDSIRRVRETRLDVDLLGGYAAVSSALGDDERCARLVGATWAMVSAWEVEPDINVRENWLRFWGVTPARDRMGQAAWDRTVRAGREDTFQDALELASELLPKRLADPVRAAVASAHDDRNPTDMP
jgi:predicted ATPase/class 3 adenylate cyclase